MTVKSVEELEALLGDFPLLPVPESLELKLSALIEKVEKGELYPKDAGTGSRGKSSEDGQGPY